MVEEGMTLEDPLEGIRERVAREPYSRILGIRLVDLGPGWAVTEMDCTEGMEDLLGMTHGGALFSLVDEAFGAAGNSRGSVALALNVQITFIAPPSPREILRAEAKEIKREGRISNFEIRVKGEAGRIVAMALGTAYVKGEEL